jgi:hypothetical protein
MKSLLLALAIVLSSLALSQPSMAQTTTLVSVVPVEMIVFVPCVNSGKGEVIDFDTMVHQVDQYTGTTSITGVLFSAATWSGMGETTHRKYSGVGSYEQSFKNQQGSNDDAGVTGDFTWSYRLNIQSSQDHVLFRDIKEAIYADINGNAKVTIVPEQILCVIER